MCLSSKQQWSLLCGGGKPGCWLCLLYSECLEWEESNNYLVIKGTNSCSRKVYINTPSKISCNGLIL